MSEHSPTPVLKTRWHDLPEWVRTIAVAVNNILRGKTNNTGSVTLTANATSTAVTDDRVGAHSVVFLSPETSNAAAAIGTTYIATYGDKTFTITHANNAQTDRDFRYSVVG